MSFDEKLRQSFDHLADQLRDEAKRQLASISDQLGDAYEHDRAALVKETEENARRTLEQEIATKLAAEVAAVEARMAEAVSAAEARGAETGREAGHKAGIEEGKQAGADAARREGEAFGRQQGREEGFREGRADGLEEGRQAGLLAGREEGWNAGRAEGLKDAREVAFTDLKTTELARSQRLIEAIRAIDGAKSLTEVLDTLASSAGSQARRAAILLMRNGQLRGWRFIGFGPLDAKNDVDVPAAEAGVIAEAARTGSAVSADSAAPNTAPAFAALPAGREVLAVPVAMSGQIVAVLYADPGADDPAGQDHPRLVWPAIVELLALHAARCLEAITALRAAKALAERPDGPSSGPRPAGAPGDREDPIEAARRYARLVVSEIKLYHESAVSAGRRERDLMTRLGGEISRARVLYEQRVPADVRKGHDYFEDELIKTLAGGDASLIKARK
jgi:hypothetical protein